MRKDKGQALILDALLFLVICTMISISISNFTLRIEEEQFDYLQKYTENAHHVLLKTTVDLSGFEDSGLARNKSLNVAHISARFLLNGLEENDSRMIYFKSITSYILDRLLPACLSYQWSVKMGNYSVVISSSHIDDVKTSKFASVIEVTVNGGSSSISYCLLTWMRK